MGRGPSRGWSRGRGRSRSRGCGRGRSRLRFPRLPRIFLVLLLPLCRGKAWCWCPRFRGGSLCPPLEQRMMMGKSMGWVSSLDSGVAGQKQV